MTPARERLSALIVVMASILLAMGLAGLVYYYKIKQNEDYQNQLHFRELKLMIDAFDKGVDQVISAARLQNDREQVLFANRKPFEELGGRVRYFTDSIEDNTSDLRGLYESLRELQAEVEQIDKQILTLEPGEQEQREVRRNLKLEQRSLEDEILTLESDLANQQSRLYDLRDAYEAYWITPLVDLVFSNDNNFTQRFGSDCDADAETICEWLDDIESTIFAPEEYENLSAGAIATRLAARTQSHLEQGLLYRERAAAKLEMLRREIEELKRLASDLESSIPAKDKLNVDEFCQGKYQSIDYDCRDLAYLASRPYQSKRAVKQPRAWREELEVRIKERSAAEAYQARLLEVLDGIYRFLGGYASDSIVINFIEEINDRSSEVEATRRTLFERQEQAQLAGKEGRDARGDVSEDGEVDALYERINTRDSEISKLLEEIEAKRQIVTEAAGGLAAFCDSAGLGRSQGIAAARRDSHMQKFRTRCTEYAYCVQGQMDRGGDDISSCDVDGLYASIEDAWDARFGERLLSTLFQSSEVLQNARILPNDQCDFFTSKRDGRIRFVSGAGPECGFSPAWHTVYRVDAKSHLAVPLRDLMRARLERFPLVLLVDSDGELVHRRENVTIDAFQNGLEFENLKPLLSSLLNNMAGGGVVEEGAKDKAPVTGEPGFSGAINVTLAGEKFRLFISPYRNEKIIQVNFFGKEATERAGEFYLVGFKSRAQLQSDKLAISSSMLLAGVLLVTGVIFALPLLKVRLVSAQQAFTRIDMVATHLGMLLLSGVFTIALADLWLYEHTKSSIEARAERILAQVTGAFAVEIRQLRTLARDHYRGISKGVEINPGARYSDYYFGAVKRIGVAEDGVPVDPPFYFLENMFTVDGVGAYAGVMDGDAYWSTYKLARTGGAPNVGQRGYFKRARDCDLWKPMAVAEDSGQASDQGYDAACGGIFMERLFNLRDGRRSIQFSEPAPGSLDREGHDVLSYGGVLQTFLAPVLPPNYGLIVFENRSGKVVYHSDDERSLVENFYVETDSDLALRSIVNHWRPNAPVQQRVSTYRGKSHLLTLGELHPGIPWTLAVYYQKDELRAVNFTLAFVSLIVLLILALVFALIFLRGKPPQMPLISGRIESAQRGMPETLSRFTRGYLLTLLAFNAVLILVVAVIVDITDTRYEAYLRGHIAKSAIAADATRSDYRDFFVDYAGLNISAPSEAAQVACYLGRRGAALTPAHTEQCPVDHALAGEYRHAGHQGLHDAMPFSGLINLLFRHDSLLPPGRGYLGDVDIGPEYFPDGNVRNTLLRTASALLLLLLALACLFHLCRSWIGCRLMGLDIPRQFRVRDAGSIAPTREEREPLFSSDPADRFVVVIRPDSRFIAGCSGDDYRSEHGVLITRKPLNCLELVQIAEAEVSETTPRKTPEQTFHTLLARHRLEDDAQGARVLVLQGLEPTSMSPSIRGFLLDFLEHVMSTADTRIILLCEIAPLYRMIYQDEYPHRVGEEVAASSAEVVRWSDVLRRFRKVYDWTPTDKLAATDADDTLATLLHEANGWPELEEIWKEFWIYCTGDESLREANTAPSLSRGEGADKLDSTFSERLKSWQPQQVIEFFSAHAGPYYRFRWELCTRAERLMLYQLAKGQQPNPENLEPLEHLARRGYIFYAHGWHLVNESFARFVKTAESSEVFAHWINEACDNTWKYLRLPLFAVVLALLAIVVYSATDALESALAILTGILGLIPLAWRSFAMFRGAPSDA